MGWLVDRLVGRLVEILNCVLEGLRCQLDVVVSLGAFHPTRCAVWKLSVDRLAALHPRLAGGRCEWA
eukprot:172095-Chlamydomonas_euryale.AAC.1